MTDLQPLWNANSRFDIGAVTASFANIRYLGRLSTGIGGIPMIWCHQNTAGQALTPWPTLRDGRFSDGARSLAHLGTPVMIDAQGGETMGNDAATGAGGYIDDCIAWAAATYGTRTDKVMLWADSAGGFNALNWAWRNAGKVLSIIMRAPATDMQSLYDRNPLGVAALMDTAYGGAPGFAAAVATHDPMQNTDLIRPFGHRIKIWYGLTDFLALPEEIEAFATLVGAELRSFPGGHEIIYETPPGETTVWAIRTRELRASAVWNWQRPWTDLTEYEISRENPAGPETWDLTEVIAVGGRRGRARNFAGGGLGTNDRRVFTIPGFQAADSELYSEIHSWNAIFGGQQGNFHRVIETAPGVGEAHVVWQNFLFASPWILNVGVWVWNIGTSSLDTNQTAGITPPGLLRHSGGDILGSSRVDDVYTFVCDFETVPTVGDIISTFDIPDATFLSQFDVTGVDVTTGSMTAVRRTPDPEPDDLSGGAGIFGNHTHGVFPYALRTQVIGPSPSTLHWKVWPLGTDEPEWGDPDWSGTETFESGHASGYGEVGFLLAHLDGSKFVDQGRMTVVEL